MQNAVSFLSDYMEGLSFECNRGNSYRTAKNRKFFCFAPKPELNRLYIHIHLISMAAFYSDGHAINIEFLTS